MSTYVLYGTLGCHLCDLARDILAKSAVRATTIDIADDPTLMTRYATRIPVLRNTQTQKELDWPFEQDKLRSWVAEP